MFYLAINILKVVFWLLDINSKIDKDKNTIELWLWGINEAGERILLVERDFTAYLYAILTEGANGQKILDTICRIYGTAISKTEVVSRRFFGKPYTSMKISYKNAIFPREIAEKLRSIEGIKDCLEEDIRAAMRYLIDNDVVPCSWIEVNAVEEKKAKGIRVAKVYTIKSPLKQLERSEVPALRILSFNLICYSHNGAPKADLDPILMISTSTNIGEEHQFILGEDKNDKIIIEEFINYIKSFDPDVIASYGANNIDWAYLRTRSHKSGIKMIFDRMGIEPHSSLYGHVSATGLINLDLADFIDVFPEIKVHNLRNLAEHLDVLKESRSFMEEVDFANYWDDYGKRYELVKFGSDNACKVNGLTVLLLDFAMQLSILTSLPLDYVMTAAPGFRIEWYLIKRAMKIGELIPKRVNHPYVPYTGGLVFSPKPGLHENIGVLDFKSMYPNIMLKYNLSPDTYIAPNQTIPPGGVYIAPEVGHCFRKSPPGFYKEALTNLIKVRNVIRQKINTLNPQTIEYHVLEARQKAVKIITNAAYGYSGWVGARWYLKPIAEAASAWGRDIITLAAQIAKKAGLDVVYGDTDSLFIQFDESKVEKLRHEIESKFKMEVEVDEIYRRIFFTEAKKRYAGLRQNDTLDIVGLEVIRGDWAMVAKQVQENVLKIILKEKSPKKAEEYVNKVITDLHNRKIPLSDLIIWKTLTKPPEKYAINTPHVEAAKILRERGWRLTSGDKVGYIIVAGKGNLFNRVKPYVFAKPEDVDVEYYVTNQVLPAATRILGYFNITKKDLLKKETKEIRSLMDYL